MGCSEVVCLFVLQQTRVKEVWLVIIMFVSSRFGFTEDHWHVSGKVMKVMEPEVWLEAARRVH